ncbi:MAG TPA: TMEM175 family protein [Propionibacteriaceae bacterium]
MSESQPPTRARGLQTGRMSGFSDGVFSIAITLLVLEIGVPAGSENDLLGALAAQWPSYLGYLVSFATIGAVWFGHTVITEYLDHANSMLVRLNLLLLLVVAFLPFPTRLLAEYTKEADAERVAATLYGINLVLTLVLLSVLWRYAVREQLVRPDLADQDVKTLTKRLTPTLGVYLAMIVVGLFLPLLAVFGYLALAVFILLPFSGLHRRAKTA